MTSVISFYARPWLSRANHCIHFSFGNCGRCPRNGVSDVDNDLVPAGGDGFAAYHRETFCMFRSVA